MSNGYLSREQMLATLAAGGVIYWRGRTISRAEDVPAQPETQTRYYIGQRRAGTLTWQWALMESTSFAEAHAIYEAQRAEDELEGIEWALCVKPEAS